MAPFEIPSPEARSEVLAGIAREDAARARGIEERAARGELEHDVRVLGQTVRAFGAAELTDDAREAERAGIEMRDAARRAVARAPDDVLALRAWQMRVFLREMRAFERTGEPSAALAEVSGKFARSAAAYGWYSPSERRLAPGEGVLAALFKKRWNEMTGLRGPVFALPLDEERAAQAFLLAHPAVEVPKAAPGASPEVARAAALAARVRLDQKRLEKVRDLAALDPAYPAALAEGVVLFRLGRYEAAATAFGRHLEAFPDGPWTLRARNYLKAALEAR